MPKKEDGVTTYDIIKAIHQAATDAYDGSEHKIGLNREEGNPILDSRLNMDGFKVSISGNVLHVFYHGIIDMSRIANKGRTGIMNEMENMLNQIVSFIKKQYRAQLKETLKLKDLSKEAEVTVESSRFNRTWIKAKRSYEIQNIKLEEGRNSWEQITRDLIRERKISNLRGWLSSDE